MVEHYRGYTESYRQHFSVIFSDFYVFESLLGLESPDLDEQAKPIWANSSLTTSQSEEWKVFYYCTVAGAAKTPGLAHDLSGGSFLLCI
jgi:hypothetical protein